MKKKSMILIALAVVFLFGAIAFAAYHHEGESDAANFLAVFPEMAGSKLDHCALCHIGGQYEQKPGVFQSLGSCQWCHYSYGYDGSGNIVDTLNQYGIDYFANGRNSSAISAIENLDSDGDGYTNNYEIQRKRFPGDSNDDPKKKEAPYRIYTKSEIQAMTAHTQFLLMNTSRSGDFYAEYTGVPMEALLNNAQILSSATGITIYSPDGWATYHPLTEVAEAELYHVKGTYPSSSFYKAEDSAQWCDYSAPSCTGRSNGDPINVTNGLKMILAYKREGIDLDKGILNDENKLDGEGPFRVVVPQKNPGPPDQSSKSSNQSVTWPYDYDWDHNAGSCSRSATIIKVEPLPEGTTDINVLEAGWNYVDEEKIIIYGAITEKSGPSTPGNTNGTETPSETDTPSVPDNIISLQAYGSQSNIQFQSQSGTTISDCQAIDNPSLSDTPSGVEFPYGLFNFTITGVLTGGSTSMTISLPEGAAPTTYYKYGPTPGNPSDHWYEFLYDGETGAEINTNIITLHFVDGKRGDSDLDATNGTIVDPGGPVLADASSETHASDDNSDDDGICFIRSLY